jgi:hypothetical protein
MEGTRLSSWLEDIEDCFGDLSKDELLSRRQGVDYRIKLTTDGLKPSLLILTKPEDQQFIKDYLNEKLRKNYIRSSKSSIEALLFLVLKKGGKRPVVNYRKLNEVTIMDSISLPLIDDILNII